MRAFGQDGLWDRLAANQALGAAQVDELVGILVPFHDAVALAPRSGHLGSPARVSAPVVETLDDLNRSLDSAADRAALSELRAFESESFVRLRAVMAQRLIRGRVRECHGDLHLGNVTMIDGHAVVFDGIEFNDELRWIDVMNEVAFMAMDLHAHGLTALAHRFVNGYLEASGDYDGASLLRYYMVYRALVRAKVALLRAAQCVPPHGAASAGAGRVCPPTHRSEQLSRPGAAPQSVGLRRSQADAHDHPRLFGQRKVDADAEFDRGVGRNPDSC